LSKEGNFFRVSAKNLFTVIYLEAGREQQCV